MQPIYPKISGQAKHEGNQVLASVHLVHFNRDKMPKSLGQSILPAVKSRLECVITSAEQIFLFSLILRLW